MITIRQSSDLLIKEFNQEIYDSIVTNVDFTNQECSCGSIGSFVKIGCYSKFYKTSIKRICIQIQRVKCKYCGKTHAIFIECMVPSSMLLLTTQLEMLKSFYNHTLDEFLANYPIIDKPNIFYIIKNYERTWKKKLKQAGLSLKSKIKEISDYFLENHHIQFMQMKTRTNLSDEHILNLLI